MKKWQWFLVVGVFVLAVIALGVMWLFDTNQKPETSPISEYGVGEVLTKGEATKLAEKLVSQDEAVYAEAWSHDNTPPIPPTGTTIIVNGVESSDGIAVMDVTVTIPNAVPEDCSLLVQLVDGQWQIYTMEVISE